MSHIRVLNLLNNRSIVSPNAKPGPKGDASELPFNQVYETLRSEARRPMGRVENRGRSGLDRSEDTVRKADRQAEGMANPSEKTPSVREQQGDLAAEVETDRGSDTKRRKAADRLGRTNKEENPTAFTDVHRRDTRPTRKEEAPTDENLAPAAEPANTGGVDPFASEAVQVAPEQRPEPPPSADAQGSGATGGSTDASGETVMTETQRSVVLLTSLQRSGVNVANTSGSGNPDQTKGMGEVSKTILPLSTDASSNQAQSRQQASNADTQQGTMTSGQDPASRQHESHVVQVRTTMPADAQSETVAGSKAQATGVDTGDRQAVTTGDVTPDEQDQASQQDETLKYRPRSEGKVPVGRPSTSRTGQATTQPVQQPKAGPVQDKNAGESQPDVHETPPLVRQTEEHGARIEGGRVIRMSTAPVKSESTASSFQGTDGKTAQRGQSLAVQAAKAIAGFILEPSEAGLSDSAGVRSQPAQSDTSVSATQAQTPSGMGPTTSQGAANSTASTAVSTASGLALGVGDGASPQAGKPDAAGLPPSLLNAPGNSNVDRMVSVLKAHVGQHTSEIRLQLDPPDLGQVRIDVHMRQGTLLLDVETETSAGRDLINSRMEELRDALARHGIVVERVNVQMRQAVYESPQPREQPPQQSQQHQQHAHDQGQSANQEAPGQTADQSYAEGHGGDPAPGDDVPAPQASTEPDERTDDPRGGGVLDEPATESLVDLVA